MSFWDGNWCVWSQQGTAYCIDTLFVVWVFCLWSWKAWDSVLWIRLEVRCGSLAGCFSNLEKLRVSLHLVMNYLHGVWMCWIFGFRDVLIVFYSWHLKFSMVLFFFFWKKKVTSLSFFVMEIAVLNHHTSWIICVLFKCFVCGFGTCDSVVLLRLEV